MVVGEAVKMGMNAVYSLVHLVMVAKHVQLWVIRLHQMGRLVMQLSCRAANNKDVKSRMKHL
jgi:hypothetical protein